MNTIKFTALVAFSFLGLLGSEVFAAPSDDAARIELSATPGLIREGESTVIAWSVKNARYCDGEDGLLGVRNLVDTARFSPYRTMTRYTLACKGFDGNTVRKYVTVEMVSPTPSDNLLDADFTADRPLIRLGESVQLTWASRNANDCRAESIFFQPDGTRDLNPQTDRDLWNSATLPLSSARSFQPRRTGVYTLTCTKGSTIVKKTVRVVVSDDAVPQEPRPTPNVKVNLFASQTIAPQNALITIGWYAPDTSSCAATGSFVGDSSDLSTASPSDWYGQKAYTGTMQVRISRTTRYSLECFSKTAASTKVDIVVAVEPLGSQPLTPTVQLLPAHASIAEGEPLIVSWLSQDAVGCASLGEPDWFGFQTTSGEVRITPRKTTVYRLTCWNGNGTSVTKELPVTVDSVPDVDLVFTAVPGAVRSSEPFRLDWRARNGTTCTASNGWSGSKASFGSEVTTIDKATIFGLQCFNAAGRSAVKTLLVPLATIVDTAAIPILDFTSDATEIKRGDQVFLSWYSAGMDRCESGSVSFDDNGKEMWGATNEWHSSVRSLVGTASLKPDTTIKYFLDCFGTGMRIKKSVKVVVQDQTNRTPTTGSDIVHLTLSVDSPLVREKSRATVSWATGGATWCVADGIWSGPKNTGIHSAELVIPSSGAASMECFNDKGFSTLMGLTVLTYPAEIGAVSERSIQFESLPRSPVPLGTPISLSWDAHDLIGCSARGSDDWIGFRSPKVVSSVLPTDQTTYYLTCWNSNGTVRGVATLPVVARSGANVNTIQEAAPHASVVPTFTYTRIPDAMVKKPSLKSLMKKAKIISRAELSKIPLSLSGLGNGKDTDRDGLSDMAERALGTNPARADSDKDGSGFAELKANPLKGRLP